MGDVAGTFRWYADWVEDTSPLYERLARGVADDATLLDLAMHAPDDQPSPQLLFAAVHDLLLRGADHPLENFYPTRTDDPHDTAEVDPFPVFREFCLDNANSIRDIVTTRRVQTNEIGRSAVLLPAFSHVSARTERPLALVEIGTCAGLNLYWDHFLYEYERAGSAGNPDSPVHIDSAVRGGMLPPLTVPAVEFRLGVDTNPLDVTDAADARWLRALVVPEQAWRHDRLAAAIDMVNSDPPRIVQGDATEVPPSVLDEVPPDLELCVFSTHTLYPMDDTHVTELRKLLIEYSRKRPIHWLSDEPVSEDEHATYRHVALEDGIREQTQLATYDTYGRWVRWLVDTSE